VIVKAGLTFPQSGCLFLFLPQPLSGVAKFPVINMKYRTESTCMHMFLRFHYARFLYQTWNTVIVKNGGLMTMPSQHHCLVHLYPRRFACFSKSIEHVVLPLLYKASPRGMWLHGFMRIIVYRFGNIAQRDYSSRASGHVCCVSRINSSAFYRPLSHPRALSKSRATAILFAGSLNFLS
jgi:hypothetical protein